MYIDTSVAVKLYVKEPDSENCEAAVAGFSLVSSEILICEFRSALLRKVSNGNVSGGVGDRIWQQFNDDIASDKIVLVPASTDIVRQAAAIIGHVHPSVPLRTLDALHLATCLETVAGALFSADKRMLHAARLLDIELAG